ncbi:MAG: methyltransferase [Bacteroidetes bacterium]|nr:MAG: methyltransferase [Bacteroidota bacterium]
MDFLPENINEFCEKYTSPEPEYLYRLNRETWLKTINPRMLAGHLQGRVISMLSQMIQPKVVLEIGTFTGYSALCWAEGALEKVITVDCNEELEEMAKKYFALSPFRDKIEMRIGNALEIIPQITEKLDAVYIDADKTNYSNYFDLVIDKVPSGGYIIADNVLWSGKVTLPENEMDEDTKALVEYCEKVHNDPRVFNVIFPIRDGLMICRKI